MLIPVAFTGEVDDLPFLSSWDFFSRDGRDEPEDILAPVGVGPAAAEGTLAVAAASCSFRTVQGLSLGSGAGTFSLGAERGGSVGESAETDVATEVPSSESAGEESDGILYDAGDEATARVGRGTEANVGDGSASSGPAAAQLDELEAAIAVDLFEVEDEGRLSWCVVFPDFIAVDRDLRSFLSSVFQPPAFASVTALPLPALQLCDVLAFELEGGVVVVRGAVVGGTLGSVERARCAQVGFDIRLCWIQVECKVD